MKKKIYYENGNIKSEGNYYSDKKNGLHKEYSENGQLKLTNQYIFCLHNASNKLHNLFD